MRKPILQKSKAGIEQEINKPIPSSEAALKRMKAAKQRDTAAEKSLRSALHKKGLRFRIDVKPVKKLNRRADVVFRSTKVAIFVDGCFWHGCPIHGTHAKANAEFWKQKIKRNQERDTNTTRLLKRAGWRVVRVWEHESSERAAEKIYNIIVKRKEAKREWHKILID